MTVEYMYNKFDEKDISLIFKALFTDTEQGRYALNHLKNKFNNNFSHRLLPNMPERFSDPRDWSFYRDGEQNVINYILSRIKDAKERN